MNNKEKAVLMRELAKRGLLPAEAHIAANIIEMLEGFGDQDKASILYQAAAQLGIKLPRVPGRDEKTQ